MMPLFDKIAHEEDRIRVSVLEGLQTNKQIPKDYYQEDDLCFFVTDIASFIHSDDWLKQFSHIIFRQKPENMTLFPGKLQHDFRYLMSFKNGMKVDLTTFH